MGGSLDGRLKVDETLVRFGALQVEALAVFDELLPDVVAWSAVILERLQNSLGHEVDQQSLTLRRTVGGVVLKAIFSVSKVVTLLVDIILGHLVVLWRLRKHQHRGKTQVKLAQVA